MRHGVELSSARKIIDEIEWRLEDELLKEHGERSISDERQTSREDNPCPVSNAAAHRCASPVVPTALRERHLLVAAATLADEATETAAEELLVEVDDAATAHARHDLRSPSPILYRTPAHLHQPLHSQSLFGNHYSYE